MASNNTELSALTAISPIDGRYWDKLKALSPFFSEFSLIKYRVHVEIEYFICLCQIPLPQLKEFSPANFDKMREWSSRFSEKDANRIKEIEKTTNHDLKAVEYWIKEQMEAASWKDQSEFIHFGLTSQDINNTAIPLSLKDGVKQVLIPAYRDLIKTLKGMATEWLNVAMLAHTHGQPATPTRVGKELMVFVDRLEKQFKSLENLSFEAKFGGATGNLNAHHVAYPSMDWISFANHFVNDVLGLEREQWTTQISSYDNIAALCDNLKRLNTILIDLCRDCWTYISMEYFKQKIVANEVGSSAMPHKVNPIDFENAEGNFGIANALFEHLSAKLPISRLQRDLTDSTVLRNLGVPIAHTLLSIQSLKRGLGKIILNQDQVSRDLEENFAVVAEAVQTILRREAYPHPYEALKNLTRTGGKITKESMSAFVDGLQVNDSVKEELKNITPFNYTGVIPQ